MEKKKAFISSFDISDNVEKLVDAEQLKQIKKNFKIHFNKETGKIDISQKFSADPEKIEESVLNFENKVGKMVGHFLNDFSNLTFNIKGSQLELDKFFNHPNLEIKEAD